MHNPFGTCIGFRTAFEDRRILSFTGFDRPFGVPLEIEAGCVELLSNLTPPQLLGLQLRVIQRLNPFSWATGTVCFVTLLMSARPKTKVDFYFHYHHHFLQVLLKDRIYFRDFTPHHFNQSNRHYIIL